MESYNYPVGIEGGNGGNCPTQNLVDAYETTDGCPVVWLMEYGLRMAAVCLTRQNHTITVTRV